MKLCDTEAKSPAPINPRVTVSPRTEDQHYCVTEDR